MLPLPRYYGFNEDLLNNLLICFSNGTNGIVSGYALVSNTFRSTGTSIITFPFYITQTLIDKTAHIQECVRKQTIFPTERKPFYKYDVGIINSEDFSIPQKESCTVRESVDIMGKTLSFLGKNYSRVIFCRNNMPASMSVDKLVMSIFNCNDVLPDEINSENALWVKVFGEMSGKEYIDVVFTNNPHMFSYDGFSIDKARILPASRYWEHVNDGIGRLDRMINKSKELNTKSVSPAQTKNITITTTTTEGNTITFVPAPVGFAIWVPDGTTNTGGAAGNQ